MSTSDKLGIFPGAAWFVDLPFWWALSVALLLTPVGTFIVGIIGESRILPIHSSKQFQSFLPGDIFLGLGAAALVLHCQRELPSEGGWWRYQIVHAIVLGLAVSVAAVLAFLEYDQHLYGGRAILSPTRLYRNVFLDACYGYVMAMMLIALLSSARSWELFATLTPVLIWLVLVYRDSTTLSPATAKYKASHAHIENWKPIWWR